MLVRYWHSLLVVTATCTKQAYRRRMYQRSLNLLLESVLVLLLYLPASSAATVCNASLYGNPNPSDCSRILLGNRAEGIHGLDSLDRRQHLFYTGDFGLRPSDVTIVQWLNRVDLAKTMSIGQ